MCLPQNQQFSLSAKMNGTQRRRLVSPLSMLCVYCGMPKGTSQAETMLNGEATLAIVELHWSEGIRKAGNLVSQ